MRFVRPSALLLVASALSLSAFAQTPASAQDTSTPNTMAATGNYATLRDTLATQGEELNGDVMKQRAILRKNQELLKEAQRLDTANKKMLAEKQHMMQQNAELERQRAALAQTQTAVRQEQPQAQPPAQSVAIAKASPAEIR